MKVNEDKTQVLCVSAATTSSVESYINANTKRITSGDSLKILGFWFGTDTGVETHVKKLEEKFRLFAGLKLRVEKVGKGMSDRAHL